MICHRLENDLNTFIAAKILGIPIQVESAKGQEAYHETVGIDQGGNAIDEDVDTGTSPVNECCNASETGVDNTVVHSECPLCMCWNQWSTPEIHISWFQDKWPTQRQQPHRDVTIKIIKFLDNENQFEVNSATQHSLDAGIFAHESGNVDMEHS